MINPQKRASYDIQLKQKSQGSAGSYRSGTGQTNQQYYQEYRQDQRRHEQRKREQQERQRRQDEEDLRRQREYERKYPRYETQQDKQRRESYEERYQEFQKQFEDLLKNMRRNRETYTQRETARAQEEFFTRQSGSSVRGSSFQQAVYGNLTVRKTALHFLRILASASRFFFNFLSHVFRTSRNNGKFFRFIYNLFLFFQV